MAQVENTMQKRKDLVAEKQSGADINKNKASEAQSAGVDSASQQQSEADKRKNNSAKLQKDLANKQK